MDKPQVIIASAQRTPIVVPRPNSWCSPNPSVRIAVVRPATRPGVERPMRIGILSDTHDELARTRAAIRVLRDAGAEALIHCGDLASPPIVEVCAALPFWFVFGNHDADAVPALERAAAAAGAICLGWTGTVLTSVTLYAEDRALPGDREIATAWAVGLSDEDRRAYEAALGGVRALSRPGPASLHALLAWTLSVDGSLRRAVSLRLRRLA